MNDRTATLSFGQDVHAGSDNMMKRVSQISLCCCVGNLKRRKSRQLPLCFPCCVEYADQGHACPSFARGHCATNCIQAQWGSRATGDGRRFSPFFAVSTQRGVQVVSRVSKLQAPTRRLSRVARSLSIRWFYGFSSKSAVWSFSRPLYITVDQR